jgi:hypothetical protein
MANAISVRTTLRSENIRIPELLPFVGKRVQIIIVDDDLANAESPTPPDTSPAPKRTLGSLRGLLAVPEGFDDPLPDEILCAFEGEADE